MAALPQVARGLGVSVFLGLKGSSTCPEASSHPTPQAALLASKSSWALSWGGQAGLSGPSSGRLKPQHSCQE